MPSWAVLLEILILLGAALLLGTLAEQVRQSAILGYLLAGGFVGPNVLDLVGEPEHVRTIAELGVALLLFTIGLEFSFRRLRRLGRVALVGGTLQVVVTTAIGAALTAALGLDIRAAIAVGTMVAMSSTACVLRLLVDRVVIDSVYGRNALGILLLQDLALIPLMLLVVLLSAGDSPGQATMAVGRLVLLAAGLVVGFVVVLNGIVPRILNLERWARSRELPILLAIVLALGSALAAHAVSLSPAIGAFLAGVLLGESPFATQIRADVAALKTLLVTLFFSSIGMLGDPGWILGHWHLVTGAVLLVMLGKAVVVAGIVRLIGFPPGIAVATALCLAQVGEFSFVLAETARGATPPLIGADVFNLVVSTTIATLFMTPFLIAAAPRAADLAESIRRRLAGARASPAPGASEGGAGPARDIVIIGFGPAGQSIAGELFGRHQDRILVIELNTRTAAGARRLGLPVHLGDATHREILEHAGVAHAHTVAITVPDASATRTIIQICRHLAPGARIIARSRYHVRRWEIRFAGADEVVDEEEQVGLRIAAIVRDGLSPDEPAEPGSGAASGSDEGPTIRS